MDKSRWADIIGDLWNPRGDPQGPRQGPLEVQRGCLKNLRGWISKDFDIETPMKKLKNEFMCLGKGKPLGEMGFTKKM